MAVTSMKSIGWVEIHRRKYGGVLYNEQAREALKTAGFDVSLVDATAKLFPRFRYFKMPESLICLFLNKDKKDVWVRDFFTTLVMPFRKVGKQVILIHHIDLYRLPGIPFITWPLLFLAQKLFYYNAKRADAIVVVSEFWKQHFIKKGYTNVHTIYNGFDVSQFNISDLQVQEFKKKHNLQGKPVIYLGNCQEIKGVFESYDALKDLDVHLVTSGEQEVVLPAKNLQLPYEEYLVLLRSSDIVLAMSKMQEGWNRTAHEAMLLKRPVIGSGLGGMRELLDGGKQIVCSDFSRLKTEVQNLLKNVSLRETIGNYGYEFAKLFSLERFTRSWVEFMNTL